MHPLIIDDWRWWFWGGLGALKGALSGLYPWVLAEALVVFLIPKGAFPEGIRGSIRHDPGAAHQAEGLFGVALKKRDDHGFARFLSEEALLHRER